MYIKFDKKKYIPYAKTCLTYKDFNICCLFYADHMLKTCQKCLKMYFQDIMLNLQVQLSFLVHIEFTLRFYLIAIEIPKSLL